MNFIIKSNDEMKSCLIKYYLDECSFDIEPVINGSDFTLVLNKLNLSIINNEVIEIWGFCPYGSWIRSSFSPPDYSQGTLMICDDLKSGFSHRINSEAEWPVYFNSDTGWICIGNPKILTEAVEFLTNVVAVVDSKKLAALWIKPQILELA